MSKTKELVTKSGVKAVIKEKITYGEHRDMVAVWLDEDKPKSEVIKIANKIAIETLVISIDGDESDIYNRFNNLSMEDGEELMTEITNILDPKVGGTTSSATQPAESSKATS